jgi:hypothetical protein
MTLYGLCATGNVGSVTDELEIIDGEECTIEELEGSLAFVSASDVRHWLTEWSPAPQPLKRDAVIEAKLQAGAIPGRNIPWKKFCDEIRDECNGWGAKGKPAWGFSNKQIQRHVKDLMDK